MSTTSNSADLDAWAQRFLARPVQDPSRRTPHMSTWSNEADCVERQMQEDGHNKWGWRIYRCTYQSDEQWKAFLERFWMQVDDSLTHYGATDLKDYLDVQVVEDRASLDGASPSIARQQFKQWSNSASSLEQAYAPLAQRYNFCLHVDQSALQSVLQGPPPPEINKTGYINIVYLPKGNIESVSPEADDLYMRIQFGSLLLRWYNLFRNAQGSWDTEYRKPPQIGKA